MRYRRRGRIEEATGQGAKGLWLKEDEGDLVDAPIKPNSRIDERILKAFRKRWQQRLEWYCQRGYEVRSFQTQPTWRFVVGLGAAHVLETGITLHRLFGLPIIPGSALKGVARSQALFQLAEKLGVPILSPTEATARAKKGILTPLEKLEAVILSQEDEEAQKTLLSQLLRDNAVPEDAPLRRSNLQSLREMWQPFLEVFGSTERAGSVIFLDAVPMKSPNFQLDIMNPHYPNYYRTQGQNPPADWESPNPVFFLTVSETPYLFAIAARSEQGNRLLGFAENWLKGALKELGIGAKTSADYGFWNVP
jgi:CRISPR-associated protein Cmr6